MVKATNSSRRVLVIALDSAEPSLIERWISDGTLPNLKRLRALGSYGRLASSAKWLAGSPWPTFYTGTTPADHGVYHSVQWRAEQMKTAPVGPDWLSLTPFWRSLDYTGLRVIAIDLPMAYPPEPFNGIEIYGLVNRDLLGYKRATSSFPSTLLEKIHREFGFENNITGDEIWGVESLSQLLHMRDQLIRGTHNIADLAEKLMKCEKWDLFMVNFMATHRGGHKLWDSSNCWDGANSIELSHALRDVYVACDRAVGQLVQTADKDVTTLIFSLHGMSSNKNRSHLLPEMVKRILSKETAYTTDTIGRCASPTQKLLQIIPDEARYKAPTSLLLSPFYKTYAFLNKKASDSIENPVFFPSADFQGYVRVNLQGREAFGIVEPDEYDQLCSTIMDGLLTFMDRDTKEPIIQEIKTSGQLFKQGRRLKDLPDIIVRWAPSPAANHRAIVSFRYGDIPWFLPCRHPTGRSGNHGPEGFLIAVGSSIQPNSQIEGAHILDLAPTIYALLEIAKASNKLGHSIV
jgi:predicted AlkP superfamily phosphohydrolase/phosphomutase